MVKMSLEDSGHEPEPLHGVSDSVELVEVTVGVVEGHVSHAEKHKVSHPSLNLATDLQGQLGTTVGHDIVYAGHFCFITNLEL